MYHPKEHPLVDYENLPMIRGWRSDS